MWQSITDSLIEQEEAIEQRKQETKSIIDKLKLLFRDTLTIKRLLLKK